MADWQRKTGEYEADLYPVQQTWWQKLFVRRKGGEMEIKHHAGGEKRMEIDLYKLKVPEGATVTALIDGVSVREVPLRRGFARVRLSSADGEIIPLVQHGSKAQIRYGDEVLLEGTFLHD